MAVENVDGLSTPDPTYIYHWLASVLYRVDAEGYVWRRVGGAWEEVR